MGMMRNKTTKEAFITLVAWVCVILGGIAAGFGLCAIHREDKGFSSLTNLGNFGSYAQGSVASLWSLGALFFLYATLLAQRRQIEQQEHQLELQRGQFESEQKRQKFEHEQQEVQFQLQQRALELQSYENSFYQLLTLFSAVRHEVTLKHEQFEGEIKTYEGIKCFSASRNLIKAAYHHQAAARQPDAGSHELQEIETAARDFFMQFYTPFKEELDQYFRILYHVIKYVDSSPVLVTDAERRRYTSLVRAQLSDNELFLLFYNGICPHAEKFRPLIEKYGLLEHLDKSLLLDEIHLNFYQEAYK